MNEKKVNELYLGIAEKCFERYYPEMTKDERGEILERRDFREIEGYVPIYEILSAATRRFSHMIFEYAMRPDVDPCLVAPHNLLQTVIYAKDPEAKLAEYAALLREKRNLRPHRAFFVYQLLKAVHEEWMKVYEEMFFDPTKDKERCRFMDFELIGFRCAWSNVIYIEDFLNCLDWEIDENKVRNTYYEEQDAFWKNNGLIATRRCHKTKMRQNTLVDYLMRASESVPPRVAEAYAKDRELATKVAYS